tara:strand:- start:51 stop:512 length:462 start_codon:yes stop_codon:yes gene_type:complete
MTTFDEIIYSLIEQHRSVANVLRNTSKVSERTKFLTDFLASHIHQNFGLFIQREVRLEDYVRPNRNRGGIIDLRATNIDLFADWTDRTDTRNDFILDVEIDTYSKFLSLNKLVHSKSKLGHHVLWVRHTYLGANPAPMSLMTKHNIPVISFFT